MSLTYRQDLIPTARNLRKEMTPQENRLWYQFLRGYPVRFQRQKVVDSFIADFYCHKARLIIEIDGSQHFESAGLAYDNARTLKLEAMELKVIRFSNADVNSRFREVCEAVDIAVKKQMGNSSG